jgi:hypothetical protein
MMDLKKLIVLEALRWSEMLSIFERLCYVPKVCQELNFHGRPNHHPQVTALSCTTPLGRLNPDSRDQASWSLVGESNASRLPGKGT